MDVVEQARMWLSEDPDPATRAELELLLTAVEEDPDGPAAADLAERFAGTLQFGTAGLRGPLGAGPMRMNRVVVTRAAAGLASYLASHLVSTVSTSSTTVASSTSGGRVVIGYDARHGSPAFAQDTAEVMTGAGFEALVLPRPLPTPVLAFAIRHLGCVAGVMVTASHNPPQDNGYKVYLGDGSQIVPPADADIAARIAAVGPLAEVPRGDDGHLTTVLGDELLEAYVDAVTSLVAPGPRRLRIVTTPLHGVGGAVLEQVLRRAGFEDLHVVPAQAQPDPDFPTVAFPNPEEPGAMDLAFALADEVGADLVIANDPDADRCAVGVPAPGGWRMLHGDEVGVLLGDHLIRRGATGTFAASIVSSSLLGKVAQTAGRSWAETLTGFKWISRVPGLAYGYEEALGYCVAPDLVRDKDGISAALLVAELAAELHEEGRTLRDRLDEIAVGHGVHLTSQVSIRVADLTLIDQVMQRLRATPPARLGGLPVEQVDDLSRGDGGLPPTEGLRFRLTLGARVVVRPSGTEPKLKAYLEVVESPDPDVAAARQRAAGQMSTLRAGVQAALGL